MVDWLRLLLMVFYAPSRAMQEVRDRGALVPFALIALLTQFIHLIAIQWFAGSRSNLANVAILAGMLLQSAITLVPLAVVLVPLLTLVANIFERRGSFRVVITQEYAPLAASLLYALTAANLGTILIAAFLHFTGIQAAHVATTIESAPQTLQMLNFSPEWNARLAQQLNDPHAISESLFLMIKIALFTIGAIMSVRGVFRLSILRTLAVMATTFVAALLLLPIWALLFSRLLGSPFLLLMLFFLLRGYFSGFMSTHRAKAAFKQNLEAATLNPADASAHYNLGLIHQQRAELDAARERFERAIQIDAEEIDAYYQLGRIARQQKRPADAIKNFEQVVARDPSHSQHEIWREVGATYIAAGQYEDARNALERFLDRRESDPEGLYLMGRAHAGLGHRSEAASLMEACINAVKSAPAYKYRMEKRWLNEAQQFLRTQSS